MNLKDVLGPMLPALLFVLACERSEDRPATPPTPDSAVLADTAAEGPTDREIAHTLQTSNAVILRAASLAKSRVAAGPVHAYADTLIAHHTAYNLRVMRTFLAINMVPLENEHSDRIIADSDAGRRRLEAAAGPDLERSFLDLEVKLHEHMAALLDDVFIAKAQDPRLVELLRTYRPMMADHIALGRALASDAVR